MTDRRLSTAVLAAAGLVTIAAGCQCRRVTELWLDTVDCVAEQGCHLDRLYNPGTDLTRLNKPGGNVGPNALICPEACGECPPTRDVPVPQFRIYRQPTTLAGAKESYDDRDGGNGEVPLDAVELVPPDAVDEIRRTPGVDQTDRLPNLIPDLP